LMVLRDNLLDGNKDRLDSNSPCVGKDPHLACESQHELRKKGEAI